jgi:hypothetical protein
MHGNMKHLHRLRARALCPAVMAALLALCVPASAADFGLTSLTSTPLQVDGTTMETAAGAHPYTFTTDFELATDFDGSGNVEPAEYLKDMRIDLPVGLVGDPTAVPTCTTAQLDAYTCPASAQVGVVNVRQATGGATNTAFDTPLYNLEPEGDTPAMFGFTTGYFPVIARASVRTGGDYGLSVDLRDIPQPTAVTGSTITLWGTPADPSHDTYRGEQCFPQPSAPPFCLPSGIGGPGPSQARQVPFITNPSNCDGGALRTVVTVDSWQHPGAFRTASAQTTVGGTPAGVTACDRLDFRPTLTAGSVTGAAGSPSGLAVDLAVPQNDNPAGLATPPLKQAVVTLPTGVAVAAGGGDGLTGCAPSDVALTDPAPAHCPDAAKIGSVTIDTPVLPRPLTGSIYLAQQTSNPFNSLLAMYIVAEGQGVVIKLPGKIEADAGTGQITATVDNSPQLPFSNLHLQFKAGPRAVLRAPKACGTYTTHAELTSWASSAPVTSDSTFTITSRCDLAGRFDATLAAGLTNPAAGGSSSFVLHLARPDGEQDIGGLTAVLPPGLLAQVGKVQLCPDAQAGAGTCPAASQIGTTTVAAGAGTSPLSIPMPGKVPTAVYLAGPYKGAPYSLSIVVPAQAGPLDLGVVVVRAALFVDPVDAHVTVVSDPIPTRLQGIPLDIQRITVAIDRPGFMVAPTSCDPMAVTGTATSAQGTATALSSPFQVGGCRALGFAPSLRIGLTGRGQTRDDGHPALDATLRMPAHGANVRAVSVTLPLALALDPDHSQSADLCENAPGFRTIPDCPARSIVGTATATTTLLSAPLTGPVYFVKNVRRDPRTGRAIKTLPALAIPLRGSGITLVIRATSRVVDDHLVATFDRIPDAPVSSFRLRLNGGRKGILVVSGRDICRSTQTAHQVATAQDNAQARADITVSTPCRLAVVRSSHTARALALTVGGLGAGRVTVAGAGLVRTSRTLTAATTATLRLPLSDASRRAIARGRDVRVVVRVAFTPAGARQTRILRQQLTIHG